MKLARELAELKHREWVARSAAGAAVVLASVYVIWLAGAELALAPGLPYRTDLGSHVIALRHLIHVSLPSGYLLDWSHRWFAGYPTFYFYFPLPALLIALLSLAMPLEVAAKVFAVLAPALLPPAVYAFIRSAGFGRGQATLAVAGTCAFLSLTSYSIYGGNVTASVMGEYSYALSLALAFFYLAMVAQCLRGKRRLPHMALLLSAMALAHVIPTLFAVIAAGAAALKVRAALRDVGSAWLLGFGLSAFWSVPFVLRSPDMGRILWDQHFEPFLILPISVIAIAPWAIAGAVALWRSGVRPGLLAVLTIAAAASYSIPHHLFSQPRAIPIFHLGVFVLAGIGIGAGLARAYRARHRPLLAAWVAGIVVLLALGILQMDTIRGRSASLLARGAPDSAAFQALARTLASLPAGRVNWEFWSQEGGALGDRLSLAHLAGQDRIHTSMGLLTESALTSPAYVYLLQNLSRDTLDTRRWRLPAPKDTGTARALARLRQLGVTYHVTFSGEARAWAAAQPHALRPVATHPAWTLWRVRGSRLVEPVERLRPAARDYDQELTSWLATVTDTSAWILVSEASVNTSDSPASVNGRHVSGVRLAHRSIRFETSALGIPHVVRVGYFPNWRAYGADGPWQVVPGFMLVVPRQQVVTLRFETTWVERAGVALSLVALVLLIMLLARPLPGRPEPAGGPQWARSA